MLISTAIMLLLWVLGFATVPVFVLSIVNKSSARAKALLAIDIVIPVFVFLLFYSADAFCVGLPFEVVLYFMFAIAFAIIDVASIIIILVRMRKLRKGDKAAPAIIAVLTFILVPVILMSAVVIRQKVILSRSILVVEFISRGNGGIGNSEDFIYAYDGKKITLLDMGSAYDLEKFVPSGMVPSKDNKTAGDFTVEMKEDTLYIYENGNLVIEQDFESEYYNVDLRSVYY